MDLFKFYNVDTEEELIEIVEAGLDDGPNDLTAAWRESLQCTDELRRDLRVDGIDGGETFTLDTLAACGLRRFLREPFVSHANARDWFAVLLLASSEGRITCLRGLFESGLLRRDEMPELLAHAVSTGDVTLRERPFLCRMLSSMADAGQLALDSKRAQRNYARLPEAVAVYRGTVEVEAIAWEWGVSWTLDRSRAIWFATEHGRFRNLDSAPVLLTAKVPRSSIRAMMTERGEDEVLIHPRDINGATVQSELLQPGTGAAPSEKVGGKRRSLGEILRTDCAKPRVETESKHKEGGAGP